MMPPGPSEAAAEFPLWETGLPILRAGTPSPDWADRALSDDDALATEAPDTSAAPAPDPLPGALEAARAQAEQIVARARQEARDLAEAACREALGALAAEQQEALEAVIELLREDLQARFTAAWEALEQEAAMLCASLVEPVVRRIVAADDQIVVETVREGLSRMSGARSMDVRVSPEAAAALEALRPQLAAALPSGVSFTLTPDASVSPGGALIGSSSGTLDMRIEAQVQRVREAAEALVQGGLPPGAGAQ